MALRVGAGAAGVALCLLLSWGAPARAQSPAAGRLIEPEMVEIPAGTFTMGCRTGADCRFDEKPPRRIAIRAFALAKTEVTFEEWDACIADRGCRRVPHDRGWGRGQLPVMNVSWHDVQEYLAWIRQRSGKPYRLPSEAEFEYALRAGTTTRFWSGDCITVAQANFDGIEPVEGCPRGGAVDRSVAVGAYAPNAFGLHDMAGNVAEWTQDCWRYSYRGLPEDGRPHEDRQCAHHPVRGGSWYDRGEFLRSGSRDWFESNDRVDSIGFRLALPR
jgi:serine/threonine-protein kinase